MMKEGSGEADQKADGRSNEGEFIRSNPLTYDQCTVFHALYY